MNTQNLKPPKPNTIRPIEGCPGFYVACTWFGMYLLVLSTDGNPSSATVCSQYAHWMDCLETIQHMTP